MRSRVAWAATACVLLALPAGCGSSGSDAAVRATFRHGIEQIRTSAGATALRQHLRHTLADLRGEQASSDTARRGRRLAIAGFEQTLEGVDAQIDFSENDSGELEAAARDAMRAERHKKRGADLLQAAGRALNVPVGRLPGY
jgi:hypothetical protein